MTPVVMITGASRGIGAAAALAFARAGWRVALTARTQADGQAHDHQLRRPDGQPLAGSLARTLAAVQAAGGEGFAQPLDLLQPASLDAAVDAVLQRFGRVDLLLNNAVFQDPRSNARLAALDPQVLLQGFEANVVAPLRLVQRLLPAFAAQGGGSVINIGSGAGQHDSPLPPDAGGWSFAYGAGKAALARLAGFIRLEHGAQGVRACTVNPGLTSTEAVTATLGDGGTLERRFGAMRPAAIAAGLVWLATQPEAAPLWQRPAVIDLQAVVRERGLGG